MLKDKKDTGGPAFPIMDAQTVHRIGALACEGLTDPHEKDLAYYAATVAAASGMTLRDHFAAKFCAAMVSTIRNDGDYSRLRGIADAHDLNTVSQFFAQEAYKQADAMLLERAK